MAAIAYDDVRVVEPVAVVDAPDLKITEYIGNVRPRARSYGDELAMAWSAASFGQQVGKHVLRTARASSRFPARS